MTSIRQRLRALRKIADDNAKYPQRYLYRENGEYKLTGEPQPGDDELLASFRLLDDERKGG